MDACTTEPAARASPLQGDLRRVRTAGRCFNYLVKSIIWPLAAGPRTRCPLFSLLTCCAPLPSPLPLPLFSRQPIAVGITCIWLSYGQWDGAIQHTTQAAILGSLLAASLVVAVFQLAAGLTLGGAWRQQPAGWSWEAVQLVAMFPTLLNSSVLTHWSLILGRTMSTAVLSLLYELGYAATILGVIDPPQALILSIILITHQARCRLA